MLREREGLLPKLIKELSVERELDGRALLLLLFTLDSYLCTLNGGHK